MVLMKNEKNEKVILSIKWFFPPHYTKKSKKKQNKHFYCKMIFLFSIVYNTSLRAVVQGKNDLFVFCQKNGFALRPSKKSMGLPMRRTTQACSLIGLNSVYSDSGSWTKLPKRRHMTSQ
jgi:hypothetical protein